MKLFLGVFVWRDVVTAVVPTIGRITACSQTVRLIGRGSFPTRSCKSKPAPTRLRRGMRKVTTELYALLRISAGRSLTSENLPLDVYYPGRGRRPRIGSRSIVPRRPLALSRAAERGAPQDAPAVSRCITTRFPYRSPFLVLRLRDEDRSGADEITGPSGKYGIPCRDIKRGKTIRLLIQPGHDAPDSTGLILARIDSKRDGGCPLIFRALSAGGPQGSLPFPMSFRTT